MAVYRFYINNAYTGTNNAVYIDNADTYASEEYKVTPIISFTQSGVTVSNNRNDCQSNSIALTDRPDTYNGRRGMSVESIQTFGKFLVFWSPQYDGDGATFSGQGRHNTEAYTSFTNSGQLPAECGELGSFDVMSGYVHIATNIPIFETTSEMYTYITTGVGLSSAVNYRVADYSESFPFQISCVWTHGTVTASGITPGSSYNYRMVRGNIINNGKVSLYKIEGLQSGALKYGVNLGNALFNDLEYSTDGETWISANTFPYDWFYRPVMEGDPLGTYDFAVSFYSEFPAWETEQDSEDYLNGELDISEAPNFALISNNYPLANNTGDSDDSTEFGEVFSRSFFTNQYICSEAAIQQISNALFSTTASFWEDLKKGLATYIDPVESVVSLMYYPVDLNTVFTNTSSIPYVYFGGYKFDFADSVTVNQIIYANGYFDIGGMVIERSTHSWRDLPPFTRVYVDLPYCGRYEIDPTLYYDKELKVRYFIDTHTGGCVACLLVHEANGWHCYDQYNGQIGTQLPVTLTSYSEYANTQLNTLLGNGGQAVNNALNVGQTAAAGASGLALAGGVATVAGLGAIQGAKTVYGLTQNNINKFNKTRGGSSAMLNQYLNQKVTITFETMELDNPAAFNALKGQPSNRSGNVGNFYGYFEAEQVKLNMPGATEAEKDKARNLLLNGIYI